MSEPGPPLITAVDLTAWVEKAKSDPQGYRVRRAMEILLTAIGMADSLRDRLYLKGGTLMAVAYESGRMTGDVDFTWLEPEADIRREIQERIRTALDKAMKRAAVI